MNKYESKYVELLYECMHFGKPVEGRNGKTLQISGAQIRANMSNGFPIVTGKKIYPKTCFIETEWMLSGNTNTSWLNDRGVKIWDQWANSDGDLGPVYGHQLVNFNGVNQIKKLVEQSSIDIHSRRLLCSMWNPKDIDQMALPPCHYAFQFVVAEGMADIVVSMRSLDLFIGLPYDMAMYATILSVYCNQFDLISNDVIITAGSAHIYADHLNAARLYCNNPKHELPKLLSCSTITNFDHKEMAISDYCSEERIIVEVKK
jgi:thymidylate synthase